MECCHKQSENQQLGIFLSTHQEKNLQISCPLIAEIQISGSLDSNSFRLFEKQIYIQSNIIHLLLVVHSDNCFPWRKNRFFKTTLVFFFINIHDFFFISFIEREKLFLFGMCYAVWYNIYIYVSIILWY